MLCCKQAAIDAKILAVEETAADVVSAAKRAVGNGKMATRQLQGVGQMRLQLQELQYRAEAAEKLIERIERELD